MVSGSRNDESASCVVGELGNSLPVGRARRLSDRKRKDERVKAEDLALGQRPGDLEEREGVPRRRDDQFRGDLRCESLAEPLRQQHACRFAVEAAKLERLDAGKFAVDRFRPGREHDTDRLLREAAREEQERAE